MRILLYTFLIINLFSNCKNLTPDIPVEQMVDDRPKWPDFISNEYVMGLFQPSKHQDFVPIDLMYANREGLLLHKDVYDSFRKMYDKAQSEGISLRILSATRNFDYQKGIWDRKWNGQTILSDGSKASEIQDPVERAKKILLYSSMPGTSRHHWGTDIDINAFSNEYFEEGQGQLEYNWLMKNAGDFGFCQPYTSKELGRTGYEEEKWHWTYLPLSIDLTSYYKAHISNAMIDSIARTSIASKIDMLNNYVLGIASNCQSN